MIGWAGSAARDFPHFLVLMILLLIMICERAMPLTRITSTITIRSMKGERKTL
jgi:hypothetical protein